MEDFDGALVIMKMALLPPHFVRFGTVPWRGMEVLEVDDLQTVPLVFERDLFHV